MKNIVTTLSIVTGIILSMGFLLPSITTIQPVFSQEESVFIVRGAADPNNDQSFAPPQISLSEGSTVFWTNDDSTEHTVTSDEGLFDSGPIPPGETFDNTFDSSGEFGYHCSIHPFMTGIVSVE